jgi:hypothetical protein
MAAKGARRIEFHMNQLRCWLAEHRLIKIVDHMYRGALVGNQRVNVNLFIVLFFAMSLIITWSNVSKKSV